MKKTTEVTAKNWGEILRNLEAARTVLEQGLVLTPGEKKKILKARARALAQESKGRESPGERIELIEFLLADEKYGIESTYVREVYPLKELTPLPCTPPFVLGIINVRGQILSVIDIKKFFGLPGKELNDLNRVIIVYTDEMELGILADVILGVRSVPLKEIQPPLPTLKGIHGEYLKGVTNERLVVLEVPKILSDKRMIVHEQVEA